MPLHNNVLGTVNPLFQANCPDICSYHSIFETLLVMRQNNFFNNNKKKKKKKTEREKKNTRKKKREEIKNERK